MSPSLLASATLGPEEMGKSERVSLKEFCEEDEYAKPESVPFPPIFQDKHEHREYLKSRLVWAYRFAAKYGFDEGAVGHIVVKIGKFSSYHFPWTRNGLTLYLL